MNRRHFLTVICLGAIAATTAQAASYEDQVIAQLRAQGYDQINAERTLLGRVKISAQMNGGRREIVLNPRTGEVLRDVWFPGADAASVSNIIRDTSGEQGSGSGGGSGHGGDDGGDDDHSDDHDDDHGGDDKHDD